MPRCPLWDDCPAKREPKTARGMFKHLIGTKPYGGHELPPEEAQKLVDEVFSPNNVVVNTTEKRISHNNCKTYTEKLKRKYEEAVEKNKGVDDVYYCATPGYITPRSLDFNKNYAFCEVGKVRSKDYGYLEYRIEALIIKLAKQRGWIMPIVGKEWELVDAERNFAETPSPRKPDLVAYDKNEQSYVIIEIKENNLPSSINKANSELNVYPGLLANEIDFANHVYGKQVKNVKVRGYMLLPNAPTIVTRYGVITFDISNGLSEDLRFSVVKEPE